MYENHLKKAEEKFGPCSYQEADSGEKCVLLLRINGYTYQMIQKWMGNPSKKWIRSVLLKWAPQLIDNQPVVQKSNVTTEKRLLGILKKMNIYQFNLCEFGTTNFINKENLYFIDSDNIEYKFTDWDERTQKSIFYEIANLLNLNVKENEYK